VPISFVLLAFVPLAWLLPNHYLPWPSSWGDGWALMALAVGLAVAGRKGRLPLHWAAFGGLALATVAIQRAVQHIHYSGDAWIVGLYLTAFLAAIAAGSSLIDPAKPDSTDAIDTLAGGIVVAAIGSTAIAWMQWTGSLSLGVWSLEMPSDFRAVGNLGQPNHLATVCYLGLCSLCLIHQNRRIGGTGLAIGSLWLMSGMVMASSRTAWLEMVLLVVVAGAAAMRGRMRLKPQAVLALGATFAATVAIWPLLSEWMLLAVSRTLSESARPGLRWLHWASMWEAIQREPWWGYGWTQLSAAQVRVADLGPYVGENIEHSHNFVLDLLIWNGIPIGSVLALIPLLWFLWRAWSTRDPRAVWLLCGVGGLLVHGLLEYPLEYAYFLLPFGFAAGAIDTMVRPEGGVRVGIAMQRALGVVLVVLVSLWAIDNVAAERALRLMRLESARIGAPGIVTEPPTLVFMNQYEAYFKFAATEARPGLSARDLDDMRKLHERFSYPSAMFRYALAQGLNGDPQGAALTLKRVCRLHVSTRCQEIREAWPAAQVKYPALKQVAVPDFPDTSLADSLLPPARPR
jgi:hypothetical protein